MTKIPRTVKNYYPQGEGVKSSVADSGDLVGNGSTITLTPAITPTLFTFDPMFTDMTVDDYPIRAASEIYALKQRGTGIGYWKL